jgi:hypothetical protein
MLLRIIGGNEVVLLELCCCGLSAAMMFSWGDIIAVT